MASLDERVPIGEVTDLIRVGEPLPFRVLDAEGRLLLNEGQVIASERQMEALIDRGAWVERALLLAQREKLAAAARGGKVLVAAVHTLFDRWERCLWELDTLLRRTSKGQNVAAEWAAMVDGVMALIDRDADIALFMAVRQEDRRFALYPQAHALHSAVLALLVARHAGWDPLRQRAVVGGALSMNVAMLELQALMAEQDTAPTTRQLATIRAHPHTGAQLLRTVGVTDEIWLQAVADHHERTDGSGYPRQLVEFGDEARVLRMADVYMAKITARAQRLPLAPSAAARQLFQQEPGSALAMALIKVIGIHPPGALVQIKSGEVAIVKRRAATGPAPIVCTLSDRNGKPRIESTTLDTALPEHAITGPCADPKPFRRVLGERVYGMVMG